MLRGVERCANQREAYEKWEEEDGIEEIDDICSKRSLQQMTGEDDLTSLRSLTLCVNTTVSQVM